MSVWLSMWEAPAGLLPRELFLGAFLPRSYFRPALAGPTVVAAT